MATSELQDTAESSANAILDWLKEYWMWVLGAIIVIAIIGFFIWKKYKGRKVEVVADVDSLNVNRTKEIGQPGVA